MNKRFLYIMAFFMAISANLYAEQNSNWFRHTAISPDGKTILFTAKGEDEQLKRAVRVLLR